MICASASHFARVCRSSGCVLYEMMTYKHAFDAQSIGALASKVMKGVFAALPATYPKALRTLVRDMLQLDPKARPSIHQILALPFLRKHIKTYVTAVMQAQNQYRVRDIENFKAQLRRLGMEDMLEAPTQNPVPPLALGGVGAAAPASAGGNGVVATARASSRAAAPTAQPSSASTAAAASAAAQAAAAAAKDRDRAAAAALRHREQAARLQELQEEEAQRRSLEEKLFKLKKAHEAKQQKLLVSEQQKKTAASAGVRPSSALPSARGGAASSASSSAAAAAAAAKSAKSMTPSGSKAVLGAGAAASAGGAAGKKPPAPAGAPPASAAVAVAKRPPSAGPAAGANNNGAPSYRAPSGSPSHVDERAIRPAASAVAAAADHRSSRSALQEERARKLQHDRAEHEQALRLKEIEEMRAAEAARLAEAERLDLRRKQLELAKRKKAEVEAEKVAARERDLERARAEEIARQKKVYLAQVEAEKAELERIQLEKQWISKRLDDLAQKPMSSAGGSAASAGGKRSAVPAPAAAPPTSHARNLREDTDGLSHKDRILADKAARRAAEEAETQARLLQGRRDAHQERLKVHSRAAGSVAPHMQSNLTGVAVAHAASPPRPSPALHRQDSQDYEADGFDDDSNPTQRSHARRGRDDTSSDDSDSDSRGEGEISESEMDPEEAQEDLAQEAEAIEEAEDLLLGLTKRIQDLRTSIEVPTVFSDAQDQEGWDQEVEEEEDLGDEGEVETADETEAAAANAYGGGPGGAMVPAHVTTTSHAAAPNAAVSAARPTASSSSASAAAAAAAADLSAALPSIPESLLVRMKLLAKECAQLVGRSKFVAAFECLKSAADASPPWSRDRKVEELTKILGNEKVKHWEKIEQLVFMERSSTTG